MKKRLAITVGVLLIIFLAISAYILISPMQADRLCGFARDRGMSCPTFVADPQTLRPGGVVREIPDPSGEKFTRIDLPTAYLDNETCLVPGARLAPWAPKEDQPFDLQTFEYTFNAISRFGGQVPLPAVQGIEIDAEAATSRVSKIALSFGKARTRLLDENVLLNRIESCEILPRCVERIRQNKYKVVNRVLEVDGLSYSFEDSKGAKIPLGVLLANKTIRATNSSFDVSSKDSTSLNSTAKMVIALTTIDSSAFSAASVCNTAVVFSFEGGSRANVGGGGRPGFIPPKSPVTAGIGNTAQANGRGSEDGHGDTEQTVSTASALASLAREGEQSLRVKNAIRFQGGHYGVRGPLGIGIASGHDTSANAEASNDGRINVLLRTSGGLLTVSWNGFAPPSGPPVVQQTDIQVQGPGGILENIPNVGGSGSKDVRLPGEGHYSVVVRNFARAEGSGWSAKADANVDATVRVDLKPNAP